MRRSILIGLISAFVVAPSWSGGQTPATAQGNNIVFSGSATVAPSTAFIDASAFCTSRCTSNDFCVTLGLALAKVPTTGAIVDARGLVPPAGSAGAAPPVATCANTNPFASLPASSPVTVLLPAAFISIGTTWKLPDRTRIIGVVGSQGADTTISARSGFSGDMIQMGGACSSPATGVAIEHLVLMAANSQSVNGIHNVCAQDLSYVNDVSIEMVAETGLVIDASAINSGPYSNINFTGYSCGSSGCHPECVSMNSQTRGLHGITCIGDSSVSTRPMNAGPVYPAVEVNASNNAVENVHIEGFWDGVEVGNIGSAVGNVVISNVTGADSALNGPVTNVVHICGASNLNGDPCAKTSASTSVSDVTIVGATNNDGALAESVEDDASGSAIGILNATGQYPGFTGFYALGEPFGGAGYTRFATSPTIASSNASKSFNTTNVPTWQVGTAISTSSACAPGALFSSTTGSSNFYVCTGGIWTAVF
jgi:hypothetical protein